MKNGIILLFICFSFTACNLENRKPEFKRFENINVKSISAKKSVITADVVVYNPNGISIYLNTTDVEVFANDIKVTDISQTKKTEIYKESEFKIPLKANFKLSDLIKDEGSVFDLINSSLNTLKNKEIELHFEGNSEFEVAGVKFDVPIEHDENIKLQ